MSLCVSDIADSLQSKTQIRIDSRRYVYLMAFDTGKN